MKELILLAKGHSRIHCPFDGAEVWGVNDVGSFPDFKGKKIDRVFSFDPRSEAFISEMKAAAPVTSWQPYADVQYPLDEVMAHFGSKYFTNTISYMVALAIYEGFERIRMYGVDAPYGGIYFMEKSGIEYWIGRAQQKGVEVIPCEGSHILRTHDGLLYGQRGDGLIMLYLSERMALMNLMPNRGTYKEIYESGLVRWLIALKEKERIEHNVTVGASIDGSMLYKCNHEFTADIYFTDWALTYIRNTLEQIEAKGQLPIHCVSIYEKLVTVNAPEPVGEMKPRDVRVSFVIGTKNRAAFLKNCFANLRKILKPEDEVIVVDGNSTDATSQVIKDNKDIIDIAISEEDSDATEALNKGILVARGRYIKFYPDDDVIFPQEEPVKYMDEHPEVDLLVCGGTKKFGDKTVKINAPSNYGHDPKDVFRYGACGTGFLFRRSSFARVGLPLAGHRIGDQEFALRCIEKGIVKFLPGNYYFHTIYPHSTGIVYPLAIRKQQAELIKKYIGLYPYLKLSLKSKYLKWVGRLH